MTYLSLGVHLLVGFHPKAFCKQEISIDNFGQKWHDQIFGDVWAVSGSTDCGETYCRHSMDYLTMEFSNVN
jgi:hypothetical protein